MYQQQKKQTLESPEEACDQKVNKYVCIEFEKLAKLHTALCKVQCGGMHERQSINQACCVLAHFLNTIWKSAAEAMHTKKSTLSKQAGSRQGERNHLFQFDSLFAFGP